jgi:hypothetical protein
MSIGFRPVNAHSGHLGSWRPNRALSASAAAICHYEKCLADFPNLHPYQVSFESRTHTRIASWFFPGTRRATVLLSHGYGDNQIQMLPSGYPFHSANPTCGAAGLACLTMVS